MLVNKKKKGQSTVEYLILVTAVVAVIIIVVVKDDSRFKQTLNASYNTATDSMVNMGWRMGKAFNTSDNTP